MAHFFNQKFQLLTNTYHYGKVFKEGKLKTGTGKKATSRKQAIAIGLSEAREDGEKVPKKANSKKGETKEKAPKKAAAKKAKK